MRTQGALPCVLACRSCQALSGAQQRCRVLRCHLQGRLIRSGGIGETAQRHVDGARLQVLAGRFGWHADSTVA